jgi:hypothetical protein
MPALVQVVQLRRVGHPHTQQFLSTRMVEGGAPVIVKMVIILGIVFFTCSRSLPHSMFNVFPPSSRFPTSFEVLQRARPSYNPKGTFRSQLHSQALLFLHGSSRFPCCPFCSFLFLILPLTDLMVVQRARPSYNPRGTCLHMAECPAAPRWTKLRYRQFHSTRKWGGGEC